MKSRVLVCVGLMVVGVGWAEAAEEALSERVMVFAPHPDDEALA